jgi:Zn-dependent M28 family amino/carboxypeptidase
MLEVARLLRDWTPPSTVQFVGFNLEEPQPSLASRLGSRAYARKLALDGVRLKGALVLEMVGYTGPQRWVPFSVRLVRRVPREGRFLAVVGDGRSRHLVRVFKRAAQDVLPLISLSVPLKGWLLPYSRMSDNARFWDEGFPAVMVTDTAFLRNPHYHRPTDTPETLDYAYMGRVVTTVARAVMELAGCPP